jgi:hypothetical protein
LLRAYFAKAFAGFGLATDIERTILANLNHERYTDLETTGADMAFLGTWFCLKLLPNDRYCLLLSLRHGLNLLE